jgi:hypothetical protein
MALAAASTEGVEELKIDFDIEEDVLYISFGKPVASHIDEAPRGLLLRWADADNHPSGVTALDFRSNWDDQIGVFCSAVAEHLGVPVQLVEREIKKALGISALKH